jgi:hypothetical protein
VNNQQFLTDSIFNEFNRLKVSTNQDPYSGLMTEYRSLLVEGSPDVVVVKIYDDYAEGLYNGALVLEHLKTLSPGDVELEGQSPLNIWQAIQQFEL